MTTLYQTSAPSRSDLDARPGDVLVQFGVDWCSHCQAAEPVISEAMQGFPGLSHLRMEDGAGRPLGRSFRVKLWPTLVLLRDGQELDRLVRPTQAAQVLALLRALG
jgi:thioredoxin 1